jgi:hypothetical protein
MTAGNLSKLPGWTADMALMPGVDVNRSILIVDRCAPTHGRRAIVFAGVFAGAIGDDRARGAVGCGR